MRMCGILPGRSPSQIHYIAAAAAGWAYDTEHKAAIDAGDTDCFVYNRMEDNEADTVVVEYVNTYNGVASANTSNLNATGKFGDGFYTNTTYYYTIDDDTMDGTFNSACGANLTIEIWFKCDLSDWSTGGYQCLWYIRYDASNHFSLYYWQGTDQIQWYMKAGGDSGDVLYWNVGTGTDTTDWQHFAVTRSVASDNFKTFLNGSLVSTHNGLGTWSGATQTWNIGSDSSNNAEPDGTLDEFAVSNVIRYT